MDKAKVVLTSDDGYVAVLDAAQDGEDFEVFDKTGAAYFAAHSAERCVAIGINSTYIVAPCVSNKNAELEDTVIFTPV